MTLGREIIDFIRLNVLNARPRLLPSDMSP